MKLWIVTICMDLYEMKEEEFLETHPLFLLWKISGHYERIHPHPNPAFGSLLLLQILWNFMTIVQSKTV